MKKAVIVDIDGTLAKMNGRSPFAWDQVGSDIVNEPVKVLVNALVLVGFEIILFSGRDAVCKDLTKKWLMDTFIHYQHLFMRPEGNNEKDAIIKRRMYDENIVGKYDIQFTIDDRDQVVEMWRKSRSYVFAGRLWKL
jgi:hypothetical protein